MSARTYRSNRMSDEQKTLLQDYIKKNPDSTYTQFSKDIKGQVKCSDAHYYSVKRSIYGPSSSPRAYNRQISTGPRKTATLYMTLWSYPVEKVSNDTRAALKDFLETLNSVRKSHFSIVEMKDPAVIEIRETHIRG